jgi:hypothetical protein
MENFLLSLVFNCYERLAQHDQFGYVGVAISSSSQLMEREFKT